MPFLPEGLGKRDIRSLKKEEERGVPGELCSLFSSSCPFKAKAVVSGLELRTVGSCVRGHQIGWEGEETQGKGDEVVLSQAAQGSWDLHSLTQKTPWCATAPSGR